jgi:hypothetical protein
MDHFKTINDSHGHATGDEVLKAFAHVARDVMGPDALLARIGGEEFAALLPDCRAGRARIIGLAVVRGFAEAAVSGPDGAAVRATVSIGLSEMSAATGAQGAIWPLCSRRRTGRCMPPRRWAATGSNWPCPSRWPLPRRGEARWQRPTSARSSASR